MSFKLISYLELLQPLCLVEWNHLCNFERGHYAEHYCETILFGPVVDEMSFKRFLIQSSGGPCRTIYAILAEDVMGNQF